MFKLYLPCPNPYLHHVLFSHMVGLTAAYLDTKEAGLYTALGTLAQHLLLCCGVGTAGGDAGKTGPVWASPAPPQLCQ